MTADDRAITAAGDDHFSRSARAKMQWRDRYGRWIEMGKGVKFKLRNADGSIGDVTGQFVGSTENPQVGQVYVHGDPGGLKDGFYSVNSANAEEILASIDPAYLKSKGIVPGQHADGTPMGDRLDADIQDAATIPFSEAPEGWVVLSRGSNGPQSWETPDRTYQVNVDPAGGFTAFYQGRNARTFPDWGSVMNATDATDAGASWQAAQRAETPAPAAPAASDLQAKAKAAITGFDPDGHIAKMIDSGASSQEVLEELSKNAAWNGNTQNRAHPADLRTHAQRQSDDAFNAKYAAVDALPSKGQAAPNAPATDATPAPDANAPAAPAAPDAAPAAAPAPDASAPATPAAPATPQPDANAPAKPDAKAPGGPQNIIDLALAHGTLSFDLSTGNVSDTGFLVPTAGNQKSFPAESFFGDAGEDNLVSYINTHKDALTKGGQRLGVFWDEDNDQVHLDVVDQAPDQESATKMAAERGFASVYDLANDQTVPVGDSNGDTNAPGQEASPASPDATASPEGSGDQASPATPDAANPASSTPTGQQPASPNAGQPASPAAPEAGQPAPDQPDSNSQQSGPDGQSANPAVDSAPVRPDQGNEPASSTSGPSQPASVTDANGPLKPTGDPAPSTAPTSRAVDPAELGSAPAGAQMYYFMDGKAYQLTKDENGVWHGPVDGREMNRDQGALETQAAAGNLLAGPAPTDMLAPEDAPSAPAAPENAAPAAPTAPDNAPEAPARAPEPARTDNLDQKDPSKDSDAFKKGAINRAQRLVNTRGNKVEKIKQEYGAHDVPDDGSDVARRHKAAVESHKAAKAHLAGLKDGSIAPETPLPGQRLAPVARTNAPEAPAAPTPPRQKQILGDNAPTPAPEAPSADENTPDTGSEDENIPETPNSGSESTPSTPSEPDSAPEEAAPDAAPETPAAAPEEAPEAELPADNAPETSSDAETAPESQPATPEVAPDNTEEPTDVAPAPVEPVIAPAIDLPDNIPALQRMAARLESRAASMQDSPQADAIAENLDQVYAQINALQHGTSAGAQPPEITDDIRSAVDDAVDSVDQSDEDNAPIVIQLSRMRDAAATGDVQQTVEAARAAAVAASEANNPEAADAISKVYQKTNPFTPAGTANTPDDLEDPLTPEQEVDLQTLDASRFSSFTKGFIANMAASIQAAREARANAATRKDARAIAKADAKAKALNTLLSSVVHEANANDDFSLAPTRDYVLKHTTIYSDSIKKDARGRILSGEGLYIAPSGVQYHMFFDGSNGTSAILASEFTDANGRRHRPGERAGSLAIHRPDSSPESGPVVSANGNVMEHDSDTPYITPAMIQATGSGGATSGPFKTVGSGMHGFTAAMATLEGSVYRHSNHLLGPGRVASHAFHKDQLQFHSRSQREKALELLGAPTAKMMKKLGYNKTFGRDNAGNTSANGHEIWWGDFDRYVDKQYLKWGRYYYTKYHNDSGAQPGVDYPAGFEDYVKSSNPGKFEHMSLSDKLYTLNYSGGDQEAVVAHFDAVLADMKKFRNTEPDAMSPSTYSITNAPGMGSTGDYRGNLRVDLAKGEAILQNVTDYLRANKLRGQIADPAPYETRVNMEDSIVRLPNGDIVEPMPALESPNGWANIDFNQPYTPSTGTYASYGQPRGWSNDPQELASKFSNIELMAALSDGLSTSDGVTYLNFNGQQGQVPLLAVADALNLKGVDDRMFIAQTYDTQMGGQRNVDMLRDYYRKYPDLLSVEQIAGTQSPTRGGEQAPTPPRASLIPNTGTRLPEGFYAQDPEPYQPMGDTGAGTSDDPNDIADQFDNLTLRDAFEQAVSTGMGQARLRFGSNPSDPEASIPVEAIRDALQIQGTDTNNLLELARARDSGHVPNREPVARSLPAGVPDRDPLDPPAGIPNRAVAEGLIATREIPAADAARYSNLVTDPQATSTQVLWAIRNLRNNYGPSETSTDAGTPTAADLPDTPSPSATTPNAPRTGPNLNDPDAEDVTDPNLIMGAIEATYPSATVMQNGDIMVSSREFTDGNGNRFRFEVGVTRTQNEFFYSYVRRTNLTTGQVQSVRVGPMVQSAKALNNRIRSAQWGTFERPRAGTNAGVLGGAPNQWFGGPSRRGRIRDDDFNPATQEYEHLREQPINTQTLESIRTAIDDPTISSNLIGTIFDTITRYGAGESVLAGLQRDRGLSAGDLNNIVSAINNHVLADDRVRSFDTWVSADGQTPLFEGDVVRHSSGRVGVIRRRIVDHQSREYGYSDYLFVQFQGQRNQRNMTSRFLTLQRTANGTDGSERRGDSPVTLPRPELSTRAQNRRDGTRGLRATERASRGIADTAPNPANMPHAEPVTRTPLSNMSAPTVQGTLDPSMMGDQLSLMRDFNDNTKFGPDLNDYSTLEPGDFITGLNETSLQPEISQVMSLETKDGVLTVTTATPSLDRTSVNVRHLTFPVDGSGNTNTLVFHRRANGHHLPPTHNGDMTPAQRSELDFLMRYRDTSGLDSETFSRAYDGLSGDPDVAFSNPSQEEAADVIAALRELPPRTDGPTSSTDAINLVSNIIDSANSAPSTPDSTDNPVDTTNMTAARDAAVQRASELRFNPDKIAPLENPAAADSVLPPTDTVSAPTPTTPKQDAKALAGLESAITQVDPNGYLDGIDLSTLTPKQVTQILDQLIDDTRMRRPLTQEQGAALHERFAPRDDLAASRAIVHRLAGAKSHLPTQQLIDFVKHVLGISNLNGHTIEEILGG